MSTKLYVADAVPGEQVVFLVGLQNGTFDSGQTLFTHVLPRTFALTEYVFVADIRDADYVLFPHGIKSKDSALLPEVHRAIAYARSFGKYVIVFVGGDLSHDIFVDEAIVLKGSQYKTLMRPNEIIVPPIAEDFGDTMSVFPRKKNDRPIVSFCGWAGFPNFFAYGKYLVRIIGVTFRAYISGHPEWVVFKKGLYWRRRALRVCARDSRIQTRFIIRKTFSASKKTISLDPNQARTEYVKNMCESDFVLAPKGDGNFSVRFYEALSMGRIPVLIDTDVVLPLEGIVPYDSFVVRVSYRDIDKIPDMLAELYMHLDQKSFAYMQQQARTAFERYLRYDTFYNYLFSSNLLAEAGKHVVFGAEEQ